MTRRVAVAILLLTLSVVAPAAAASEEPIRGAWTADASDKKPGRIDFQMNRRHSNVGRTMDIAAFTGLTEAQIHSATQVPVTFSLRREAGTIDYRGTFEAGFGAGQFTFTGNEAYIDALGNLGVDVTPRKTRHLGKPIDERLMQLAIHDLSTSFIRSMQAEGYRVSLDQYLEFRIFGVTPEYVRELRALGIRAASAQDLVEARIHRVSAELAREIAAAGYPNLSIDTLKQFGIHHVTPEFIRGLREAGYADIPANKLVEMKIHRVTPEFIRELKEAGYSNIPVDKLIAMRIHGVDAVFVRKMNAM